MLVGEEVLHDQGVCHAVSQKIDKYPKNITIPVLLDFVGDIRFNSGKIREGPAYNDNAESEEQSEETSSNPRHG